MHRNYTSCGNAWGRGEWRRPGQYGQSPRPHRELTAAGNERRSLEQRAAVSLPARPCSCPFCKQWGGELEQVWDPGQEACDELGVSGKTEPSPELHLSKSQDPKPQQRPISWQQSQSHRAEGPPFPGAVIIHFPGVRPSLGISLIRQWCLINLKAILDLEQN